MSRPIFHPKLERMLLPSQYGLLRSIQRLYPNGDLIVTDDFLLRDSPVPDDVDAKIFSVVLQTIWEKFGNDLRHGNRMPSCNWLSVMSEPPDSSNIDEMMAWTRQLIRHVNQRLSDMPRLDT